jgi:hypothetical protein
MNYFGQIEAHLMKDKKGIWYYYNEIQHYWTNQDNTHLLERTDCMHEGIHELEHNTDA